MVTNACVAGDNSGGGTPPPSGTVFYVDAFICDSSHPQYSSGPLSATYKNQIISAYRGFNPYTMRCPEQSGYVYWQSNWLSWANTWLESNPGMSLDVALASQKLTLLSTMNTAAGENGENTPGYSAVLDQLCSSYATSKYGVSVSASYINYSGSTCIVN